MNGGDMSEPNKDPAIKLFGAKIPAPDTQILAQYQNLDISKVLTKEDTEDAHTDTNEEPDKSSSSNNVKEEDQTPKQANEVQANAKTNVEQSESNTDQEKVFKRPDKILPCPRCNSVDTKFCYFNNYNVNQPRHFCKNCQRYWTAGGTMRNVPVGAGRRKNKHFASQYHQIIVSPDGVPVSGLETPNSANQQLIACGDSSTSFRPSIGNGTVLKFCPDAPLCESMETVLNLGDHKRSVEMVSVNGVENREESSSSGSFMTASSVKGNELRENVMQKELVMKAGSCNEHNMQPPLNCYPIPAWGVPWNSGWNNVVSIPSALYSPDRVCLPNSNNLGPVQWGPTPVPGICQPSVPLQFMPASYWGCMTVLAGGEGNMSLTGSNGCLSLSSSTSNNSCRSGNGSPTLGKHSRDPNLMKEEQPEKCILVPKTLRFDVPDEASKSPIWTTLGIKPDRKDPRPGVSIFKGFKTKKEGKGHVLEGTQFLEANPAALSRSCTFQEGS